MSDQDQSKDPSRRDFLHIGWNILLGTAALGSGYVGLKFLTSQAVEGSLGGIIVAGFVDDFTPGSVTAFNAAQLYLVRTDDGGFIALYRKCTHLDCVVLWDESRQWFNCPCHGSQFSPDGDVLNDPAPSPLTRFPVSLDEQGRILVDTGNQIKRDHVDISDRFYPGESTT